MILVCAELITFSAFSQAVHKRIKITSDIELIKLSESAYVHVSYSDFPGYGRTPSNGLIFIDRGEALLLDTPATDLLTKDLVSWLKDSLGLKIVAFVPNHWHSDCMGGLGYLQHQKIESYANQMTIDIARTKNLPLPAHGFKDSLQLRIGNKLIECYYLGAAHSTDNIVAWIPSDQILFAGCMVKSLNSKDLGNTVDGDLIAYPKTIEKLSGKFPNAKIVIPGHGPFGGIDLITHTRELLTRK